MPPGWNTRPPRNDAEYFERMTQSLFTAGLNWSVIEKKWPNFRKAFAGFEPSKVAKFTGRDVNALMKDEGIVRNERKISATVHNADQFLDIQKKFGSFKKYIDSFGSDETRLQDELQERFQHLGASTSRTFLWMVGYELTPTAEEKRWMAEHR